MPTRARNAAARAAVLAVIFVSALLFSMGIYRLCIDRFGAPAAGSAGHGSLQRLLWPPALIGPLPLVDGPVNARVQRLHSDG